MLALPPGMSSCMLGNELNSMALRHARRAAFWGVAGYNIQALSTHAGTLAHRDVLPMPVCTHAHLHKERLRWCVEDAMT